MPIIARPERLSHATCDASSCSARVDVPDPDTADLIVYGDDLQNFLSYQHGWSLWVGRGGRRVYCPEHGPSRNHTMRQIF